MKLDQTDWPLFGWTTDMRPALAEAQRLRHSVVLGTLVKVEGPSPRPVGSQMVLRHGEATGYFSGGCLEADVANHAVAVLDDGKPRRLVYGRNSPWIDIRLLCGGTLDILLERIDPDDPAVARLQALAGQRRPAFWASNGLSRSVTAGSEAAPSDHYRLRHDPPWRIVILGGDPIALAIASLSATAGFQTTIIRPDGPDSVPPIPAVRYLRGEVRGALEQIRPDRWTAVVSATHDQDIDDVALIAALRAGSGYVGVLGSASQIAGRRQRLLDAGLSATLIATLHAPIGAVRSGKAPWEVAVSVIAEIMQTRADRTYFATRQADGAELYPSPHSAALAGR